MRLRGILLQTDYISYIKYWIEENFSENKKRHTFAVCETAKLLAEHFGASKEKTELAALFHDMFKYIKPDELVEYVKRFGLDAKYEKSIDLAHSKIAAEMMKCEYDITDEDVINAVRFHTTGRAGMSLLEKIVFLADVIEPGRDYPGVEELRKFAYEDLDKACLAALENAIEYVTKKGVYIDADTLEAIKWFRK